jgi:hypothetical protein
VENQPAQGPSFVPSSSSPLAKPSPVPVSPAPITPAPGVPLGSADWPTVPPAPVPVKPPVSPELASLGVPGDPAPPHLDQPTTPDEPVPAYPGGLGAAPGDVEHADVAPADLGLGTDEHPTPGVAPDPIPAPLSAPTTKPRPRRAPGATLPPEESPLVQLQRSVRRQQAYARRPDEDLVWQPRFAYTSALVILVALTMVSLPLWLVLYRISDPASNNGSGPRVADLMALCMMLLGGFLTGAAAWVIIIEMRGRVRMVDTLAKTGEREMVAPAAPEIPVLDAPLESLMVTEPIGSPRDVPSSRAARVEAQQVSAAATLEASSKLLSAFSGVLRSFGQLWAQVAMLAVALALFVGATVLSLR